MELFFFFGYIIKYLSKCGQNYNYDDSFYIFNKNMLSKDLGKGRCFIVRYIDRIKKFLVCFEVL